MRSLTQATALKYQLNELANSALKSWRKMMMVVTGDETQLRF
jgi:hypothetical protein